MLRMLIVDDEQASARTLKLHFSERFDVDTAGSADEGLEKLKQAGYDVMISDIRMPGRDGLSLLADVREHRPETPVIMITAFHDFESTVAAMHGGAVDYVHKPIDIEELESAVEKALALHGDGQSNALTIGEDEVRTSLVGHSKAIKEVFKSIGMVSQNRVTALILGESGTGKELVARAIHNTSHECNQPFVAINCAALVETLLESEMFGHEKGAFTGAVGSRKGKVELAGEGTLFLDEVAELSPRMQGKLLRLLEEREFHSVGGNATKVSEARFITATNADLAARVESGEFREDLFYRLNVVNIVLPPLRERTEDIPVLVEHLLKRINKDIHKGIRRVPGSVMAALTRYDWPGNVRELENVLMKAVVMAQGDALNIAHLPDEIVGGGDIPAPLAGGEREDQAASGKTLKDLEKNHIERVLTETGWHKGRACEILGISRPRLERRIKEFELVCGP